MCKTCDDYGCLTCPNGKVLHNKTCIDQCPNNYIPLTINNILTCKKCEGNCKTCDPNTLSKCLSCPNYF